MSRSPEALLRRAEEHCFFLSPDDSGAALCRANVRFGIAKIQAAQERFGAPPDATFLGAPDATVTRNKGRWAQGFGYGGRIDYTGDFAVLDVKPNACGMLVAALDERPDAAAVQERLDALRTAPLEVDGVPLQYDLANGNHVLDLFETADEDAGGAAGAGAGGEAKVRGRIGRWVAILHGSGREMRRASARGLGMYWDESAELRSAAEVLETAFGTLHLLRGDAARAWWEFMEWVDGFHARRRAAQADFLFGAGRWRRIADATHQGLRGPTTALLGALVFDGDPDELHPLTLRPDEPAYLLKGRSNVRADVLERLGMAERAARLGVLERLGRANLLPHGGGYTYPRFAAQVDTLGLRDGVRRFRLTPLASGAAVETIEAPADLAPTFRGREVLDRVLDLELGEVAATLTPLYVARP
jgi:hypothetical protein